MEDRVLEYLDDIANYAARPTLALYAASRLADDIVNGKLANWREVRDAVWAIPDPWYPNGNKAVVLFDERFFFLFSWDLDAARERHLFTEGFRKMYGYALFEYRERCAVGELQPDTYWHNPDGDLSAAAIEAEEKFE